MQTTKQFIKYLREQDLLAQDLSQFTIDWVEDIISTYQFYIEEYEHDAIDNYLGSVKYQVENILNIMNPHITDYLWFKLVLERLEKCLHSGDK